MSHRPRFSALIGVGAASALFLTSCSSENAGGNSGATDTAGQASSEQAAAGSGKDSCDVQEFAMGLRWQQQSAEARALQQQTFSQATRQLVDLLADYTTENSGEGKKRPAIITDLDETIIDNSKLLARDLGQCHNYADWSTWDHWEKEGDPDLIPGAVDFLKAADELGIEIFYISDRQEENKEATIKTLRELGIPQLGDTGQPENVLLLGPPKEERREKVEKDHHVLMQLGDTLHDFDSRFADADLKEQQKLVEENWQRFGRDWIVLPNATYGTWEDAKLNEWDAPIKEGDYN